MIMGLKSGLETWEQYALLNSGTCFCKYYDHFNISLFSVSCFSGHEMVRNLLNLSVYEVTIILIFNPLDVILIVPPPQNHIH
jgi:hypothetical protein